MNDSHSEEIEKTLLFISEARKRAEKTAKALRAEGGGPTSRGGARGGGAGAGGARPQGDARDLLRGAERAASPSAGRGAHAHLAMPLTGEEIRANLAALAARWSVYEGSERSEAQTFLNDLFACYGVERRDVARFEEPQAGRFLDLIWPRVCIIEMKAPREAARLAQHREQALRYWIESADPAKNTPAPKYVVLCAFKKLEVWEPGAYPGGPRLELDLIDLPDQYDALLFLAGGSPYLLAVKRQSRAMPPITSSTSTTASRTAPAEPLMSCATSCFSASGACSLRTWGRSRAPVLTAHRRSDREPTALKRRRTRATLRMVEHSGAASTTGALRRHAVRERGAL